MDASMRLTSIRPWFTTGIALVGASAIVMAPVTPIAPASPTVAVRAATAAIASDVHLTALDLPYILTLPIVRQQIRNWAENWAVYLAGLGQAGVGLVQSVLAIPGVTVEAIQQVLALNFVGAFDTVTTAIRDSVIAVGQPLLDSVIWRNQKAAAVQTALYAATPLAFLSVVNGFLQAGNIVTTSLITGTQDFVAAVLTLNLGNIVNAALDGTKNFIASLGEGAGAIVAGIEAAQKGIADALATPPPPSPFLADVSAVRTLSSENTLTLGSTSKVATLDAPAPTDEKTDPSTVDGTDASGTTPTVADETIPASQAEPTGVVDPVGTGAEADPTDSPQAPAGTDAAPPKDDSHDATAPATPPKKPVHAHPIKDAIKNIEDTIKKVTGVEKTGGAQKSGVEKNGADTGAGAEKSGAAAKASSGADAK
jgi:hypothetical protein